MLVGQLPSKEDFQQYIEKAKKIGEEKLKDVEGTASKILQQVEKAKKEGKGQADAFLAGLKQGTPPLCFQIQAQAQPPLPMWTL